MTRVRTAAGALLAAGAAMVASAGAASADGAPEPSAAYPGGVVVASAGGFQAVVRVAYTCTTDVTPGHHLFLAVKQGDGVSPDNPSSGQNTTAFLSTNWAPDTGGNALVCDGERHVQRIVVKPQPGTDYGPLRNGPALVQICVYDNITGFNGEEPIGGAARSYTMQRIVVSHAPGAGA